MRKHLFQITGPQRLLYSSAVGLIVAGLPLPLPWLMHGLLSWCTGICAYLAMSWMLAEFEAQRTREHAQAQDQPNVVLLLAVILCVFASVGGILMMQKEEQNYLGIGLSFLSVICSWLLMHTMFAFHYVHRYYQALEHSPTANGGLQFPEEKAPDYLDFLYFSYVVGMTFQVSDVQVTSRPMRRLTLIHSVSAFIFNMLVLALNVNMIANAF